MIFQVLEAAQGGEPRRGRRLNWPRVSLEMFGASAGDLGGRRREEELVSEGRREEGKKEEFFLLWMQVLEEKMSGAWRSRRG